jgi:hypothetical protein
LRGAYPIGNLPLIKENAVVGVAVTVRVTLSKHGHISEKDRSWWMDARESHTLYLRELMLMFVQVHLYCVMQLLIMVVNGLVYYYLTMMHHYRHLTMLMSLMMLHVYLIMVMSVLIMVVHVMMIMTIVMVHDDELHDLVQFHDRNDHRYRMLFHHH